MIVVSDKFGESSEFMEKYAKKHASYELIEKINVRYQRNMQK